MQIGVRRVGGFSLFLFLLAALPCTAQTRAAELQYRFKPGDKVVYEIGVHVEFPTHTKTTSSYLVLRGRSADASTGKMTLLYGWSLFRTQTDQNTMASSFDSLAPMFKDPPGDGNSKSLVIDPLGGLVDAAGTAAAANDAQLDAAVGPAWQAVLPPLPSGGQRTWETHQQLHFVRELDTRENGRPGTHVKTRVISPADERVSYDVVATRDNLLTIQRKYEMVSLEKVGDTPEFGVSGTGTFEFDSDRGLVTSLKWDLAQFFNSANVSVKVPITVVAKLLAPAELVDIQKQMADAQARQAEAAAAAEREAHMVHNVPAGMFATRVAGTHTGGGPFTTANDQRKPVIGFRLETGSFGSRPCFRSFQPLYERPLDLDQVNAAQGNQRIVIAKEGYAVGGVTIVANEFFNAIRVTFMKKNRDGSGCDRQIPERLVRHEAGQRNGTWQAAAILSSASAAAPE